MLADEYYGAIDPTEVSLAGTAQGFGTTVRGCNTNFLNDFVPRDQIRILGQVRTIKSVGVNKVDALDAVQLRIDPGCEIEQGAGQHNAPNETRVDQQDDPIDELEATLSPTTEEPLGEVGSGSSNSGASCNGPFQFNEV